MILQDQEGVLAWVSERLAVAMRQARVFGLYKPLLNNWKLLYALHGTGCKKMQDNQREELAYLAGLFDGEGTICIQRDVRPTDKETGRYQGATYTVTFRIGMIEKHPIESFKKALNVGYIDCEKTYHKFRPMWRFSIRRRDDVRKAIEMLEPFLRVKNAQAKLALAYFETCPRGKSYVCQDQEMWDLKESFRQRMCSLNGVAKSPATTKRGGRAPSVRVL